MHNRQKMEANAIPRGGGREHIGNASAVAMTFQRWSNHMLAAYFFCCALLLYCASFSHMLSASLATLFSYTCVELHLMRSASMLCFITAIVNIYARYNPAATPLSNIINTIVVTYYILEVVLWRAMPYYLLVVIVLMLQNLLHEANGAKNALLQAKRSEHVAAPSTPQRLRAMYQDLYGSAGPSQYNNKSA